MVSLDLLRLLKARSRGEQGTAFFADWPFVAAWWLLLAERVTAAQERQAVQKLPGVPTPKRLALFGLALLAFVGMGLSTEPIPTICPAMVVQDPSRMETPDEVREAPTLVVLGRASGVSGKEIPGGDHWYHVEIEQVLYGHWPAKTVEFSSRWEINERGIFHLSPASYTNGPDFELRRILKPDELDGARALCSARFDYLVLSAESIFVGEETGPVGRDFRDVKVLRHISGREFAKNAKLRVGTHTGIASDLAPRPHPGARLFFIANDGSSRSRNPVYAGLSALPVELEPKVREALARRSLYPLGKGPLQIREYHLAQGSNFREVLFRGKMTDAIELLDSSEGAARVLGQRYLLYNPKEGSEALMQDIAALMFRTDVAEGGEFAGQKVRIETLGQLERASPTGALARLAATLLEYIKSEAQPVPIPGRDEKRVTRWGWGGRERLPEVETTDVNHSLTWLINEMEDTEIARTVEQPLLAIRSHLAGWWRQEVDLAIETADVEQSRDLREALQRSESLRPVRSSVSSPRIRKDLVWAVAISPDDTFLATGGSDGAAVWNRADWSRSGTISGLVSPLAFSPDGRSLYVNDYNPGEGGSISRYDWRTGRLEKRYCNHGAQVTDAQLSQDGRVLMASSYYDGRLILWDTASGKAIRTVSMPRAHRAVALSADGQRIVRQTAPRDSHGSQGFESVVERTDGKGLPLRLRFDFEVSRQVFTSEGRYLLSVGSASSPASFMEGVLRIDAYDLATDRSRTVVSQSRTHFPSGLAVSPRGSLVAIADEASQLFVYRLPGLAPVAVRQFADSQSISSLSFTNDEKLLIVAAGRSTPLVLRTETLEEVVPYPGHSDETEAMSFSSDSKVLRSLGRDGSICHWDAAAMKMLVRFPALAGFQPAGLRPDGKYALFIHERSSLLGTEPSKVAVVDVETGKIVSSWELGGTLSRDIFWLPGNEILFTGLRVSDVSLMRFNIATGRMVSSVAYHNGGGLKFLAKDRRTMLVEGGGRSSMAPDRDKPELVDLKTGTVSYPSVTGAGHSRTVNGETYDLMQWESRPEKEPVISRFEHFSTLSADARRLAVVTTGRKYLPEGSRPETTSTPTFIRIHDAVTLEMLWAFPASTPEVSVRFNQDGTQLAIANADGTFENWQLPP